MHRLPLILCAIAVLGSALSGWLYVQAGNTKQVLELRLSDSTERAAKLDAALAGANEQNGALKEQNGALKATTATLDRELADNRAKLSAAEQRVAQTAQDLIDTKSVLAVYEATTRALGDEVAALRQDLDESRASNASPEAVQAYKATIAELEKQLAVAKNGATLTPGTGGSTAVFASRAGRATILTVGPQSAFVVLNFGSARGAKLGQKLTVSQGPNEVATIAISDVRANFSVAQVLPDSLRGVLQKGDSALLIR
jgi:septal ring factor EnvC (AmiA/AmiB activator)